MIHAKFQGDLDVERTLNLNRDEQLTSTWPACKQMRQGGPGLVQGNGNKQMKTNTHAPKLQYNMSDDRPSARQKQSITHTKNTHCGTTTRRYVHTSDEPARGHPANTQSRCTSSKYIFNKKDVWLPLLLHLLPPTTSALAFTTQKKIAQPLPRTVPR